MTATVTALVVVGVAVVVGLGVAAGFDTTALVILAFVLVFGALAIAAARKASSGEIKPARCRECRGLISANAPYCKHCGARL